MCRSNSDFEFTIINDSSTDKSSLVLHDYAKKDSRIKIIDRENRGLIYSLNQGIKESSGEIIARMDADDICHPERFKMQIKYLKKNSNIGTLVHLIDSDGDIISNFTNKTTHDEIDQQHLHGVGGAIVHPSAMIRKTALDQVGLYDARYPHTEDLDLWLKLSEIGQLANIPEYLLRYRQHADSIGHTKRALQVKSAADAVFAAYKRNGVPFDRAALKIKTDMISIFDVHLRWAWGAYQINNTQTNRKNALKSFKLKPWSINAIKNLISGGAPEKR